MPQVVIGPKRTQSLFARAPNHCSLPRCTILSGALACGRRSCWLTQEHPDPEGEQLMSLASSLTKAISQFKLDANSAIFVDVRAGRLERACSGFPS